MKQYEIEVFERESNGRLGNRVRELEMVLFANNKKQAVDFAKDVIASTVYNSVYTDSTDDSIIGYGRAQTKYAIYATILKED